jgi:hypothetical protein
MNGHSQTAPACRKSANSGLTQCSKCRTLLMSKAYSREVSSSGFWRGNGGYNRWLGAATRRPPPPKAFYDNLTLNNCHFCSMPFKKCSPVSSNSISEPATRSLTVLETTTSPAAASPMMRAAR